MKHRHHIVPRHAGGNDHPDNLVLLTVSEHAEAHRKLYEEHGRWQDRLAYEGLTKTIGIEEIVQRKCRYWLCKKQTKEHGLAKSRATKGIPRPDVAEWMAGRKHGRGMKGIPKTEAHKEALLEARRPDQSTRRIKVSTPEGVFDSMRAAARHYDISLAKLFTLIEERDDYMKIGTA